MPKRSLALSKCAVLRISPAVWGILAMLAAAPALSAEWHVETVDFGDTFGEWTFASSPSLALDNSGRPCISFNGYADGNGMLAYATYGSPSWNVRMVDGAGAWNSSLALDASNIPRISYHDEGSGEILRYAAWNGSAWDIETVDSNDNAGVDNILVLDALGNPHISYIAYPDGGDVLKYAAWDGVHWTIETADAAGYLSYPSLALDGAGNPHIGYQTDYSNVKYATRTGSSWQTKLVGLDAGAPSLAVEASGTPHLAYSKSGQLWHSVWNGSSWQEEVVDTGYQDIQARSMVLDGAGNPHIIYVGGSAEDDLKYAVWNGSSWDIEIVESGAGAMMMMGNASLALDEAGNPHVLYEGDDGHFRYAYVFERGDMDGSNGATEPNGNDIHPFIMALIDRPSYELAYPNIDADVVGDIDGNGAMDGNDIKPFVDLFVGGSPAIPEPATMALLVVGGSGVLIRRKRQEG